MAHLKELLFSATKKAITEYAEMSRTGEAPPETFIRDVCALALKNETGWLIRIEFPARDTLNWGVDRTKLVHLSQNFLIDLVCFAGEDKRVSNIEMLVEFKLWTRFDHVTRDVHRLREILGLIAQEDGSRVTAAGGYAVCVPHYENLSRVKRAISEFSGRFCFDVNDPHTCASFETGKAGGPAAGIIILDAAECMRA